MKKEIQTTRNYILEPDEVRMKLGLKGKLEYISFCNEMYDDKSSRLVIKIITENKEDEED